jgi:hypothetical protein
MDYTGNPYHSFSLRSSRSFSSLRPLRETRITRATPTTAFLCALRVRSLLCALCVKHEIAQADAPLCDLCLYLVSAFISRTPFFPNSNECFYNFTFFLRNMYLLPLLRISIMVTVLSVLSSCTTLITGFYGMKKYKTVNDKTIQLYAAKYKIPAADSYELDSTYVSMLSSFDSSRYKTQRKNHYQPLQACYYNKTGQLESFQINCYAGGIPNFKWNRNGTMESFPPKQQAPVDSLLPLLQHLEFLQPLSLTKTFHPDSFDYTVVVHWNRFMGRQSRRLISTVQNNSKLANNEKVKIVYVNSDNIYRKQLK